MRTRDRIIELHKKGLSNAEIGRAVGVSRQRVWDVLHPKEKRGGMTYPLFYPLRKMH